MARRALRAVGIEYIVFVMMENSFDHYLGQLHGTDGKQAGLSYVDKSDKTYSTHHFSGSRAGDIPNRTVRLLAAALS